MMPFIGLSQEYKKMIVKGDNTLNEVQENAEAYFIIRGKGKGTGFKQFKRWEYNAIRLQDENGNVKNDHSFVKELTRFNREINNENARSAQVAGNWESLGPTNWNATSGYNPGVGRVTCMSVAATDVNHIIVGAQTGGVWKSTNKGTSWTPLSDNFSNMKVYAVAIDPINATNYYWGSSNGVIYKSINSGITWSQVGSLGGGNVNKIIIDATNTSKMYATSFGNGIFKSVDAGVNWTKVTNDYSGLDVVFKPGDYNTIYATGESFSKSTNGGVNWTTITTGFGSGVKQVAVSAHDATKVYVLEENGGLFGGFYVSTDSGVSFTKKNHGVKNYFGYSTTGIDPNGEESGQAPRDMAIAVSPTNSNEVHIAGILTWKSTDGGTTFNATSDWIPSSAANANIGYCHADVDDMEFIGSDLYVVSDGGIYVASNTATVNATYYTDKTTGMGIHQFYKIGVSQTNPVVISGGAQDNGTSAYKNGTWNSWCGADGMESFVDKTNSNILYGTQQSGELVKSTDGGATYNNITKPAGETGEWITPFEQDPLIANTIYAGYNKVYKSINGGDSWIPISQNFSGALNHLKIAPSSSNTMYAAIGGLLYKTITGSGIWSSVTGFSGNINSIAIHPTNPNKLAIATTSNDKVYVSVNGGVNWTVKNTGLPNFSPLALVWENNNKDGLYVGMNYGVYYLDNTLSSWQVFSNLLPNVMINELEINTADNKLYTATYGRGVWRSSLYDNLLSIEDVAELKGIVVYPNPASSTINIQWNLNDKTEVRLFSITGQLVHYAKDTTLRGYQINVGNLTSGMYFLRINSSKGELTKKIMVN